MSPGKKTNCPYCELGIEPDQVRVPVVHEGQRKTMMMSARLWEQLKAEGKELEERKLMGTTTHELARMLLEEEDLPCFISVDISTGDADANRRAFGYDFNGFNPSGNGKEKEIGLLFGGELNDDYND